MSITIPADTFFDNVCELDLVFNFYKVCAFLHVGLCPILIAPRCMQSWTRSSLLEK